MSQSNTPAANSPGSAPNPSDSIDTSQLFTDFDSVTREQWEERIRKDLKGADYERKMLWHSAEGFTVQPFYDRADLKAVEGFLNAAPGQAPFLRGKKKEKKKEKVIK